MADPPFVLDGFEPLKKIGGGGFGEVWLARQTNVDRRVAVKVGHTAIDDPTVQLRFERECIALGRLSGHPNIVEVYTAGQTDDGRPYLVLEFVNGGTLWQRTQRGPLNDQELCRAGINLADALTVAHDAGVLHRDLKPENVLLRSNGEAVLGDFGIARLHDGANTSSHSITASVAYAAPEILTGESASAASDIYGIGICLLACVLRAVPFVERTDESIQPIINRVLSERFPDLGAHGVAPELRDMIAALLHRDPKKRPATAATAARMLRDAQARILGESSATPDRGGAPWPAPDAAGLRHDEPADPPGGERPATVAPVAEPAPSDGPAGSRNGGATPAEAEPTSHPLEAQATALAESLRASANGDRGVATTSTHRLRTRTDWIRVGGAVLGGLLLVGGLIAFGLGAFGGDDTATDTTETTDTTSPTTIEAGGDVPPLPLTDEDLDLGPEVTATEVTLGPDATQFCDNRPEADGLVGWQGESYAPPPAGIPSVYQLVARFGSPDQAVDFVDSYLGTITCDEWTISGDGDGQDVVARPTRLESASTFGDVTEEVAYVAEVPGVIATTTRTALVASGAEVLILSITSIDPDDLEDLDALLRLAVERLDF